MARKCNAPGCEFPLPDKYPLDKCPWHMAPGQGPVKIAAALAIAAAGLGGGFAYKKFRTYLSRKKLRKEREEKKATSVARKRSVKSKKRPRKTSATKSKRKQAGPKTNQELS
jgi:uncharacterized protein HemX